MTGMLDQLELRRMFAANLAISYQSSTLPASTVLSKVGKGTIVVQLKNTDTAVLTRSKVDVQVRLIGDADPTGSVVATTRNVSLKGLTHNGKPKTLRIPIRLPASTPAGTYQFVVIADPENKLQETELSRADNSVAVPKVLTIDAPFSQLRITDVAYSYSKLDANGRGKATISITNDGNVTSKGTVNVSLFATTQGIPEPIKLGEASNVKVSIARGSRKAIRNLRINPFANSNLQSSEFSVFAEITPSTVPQDNGTSTQRQAAASNMLIVPALIRNADHPLFAGLGRTLSFAVTSPPTNSEIPGYVSENGDVEDELGRRGSFKWIFFPSFSDQPPDVSLTLSFPAVAKQPAFSVRYGITYSGAEYTSLKGRKLVFGVAQSDAVGLVKNVNITAPSYPIDSGVAFMLG